MELLSSRKQALLRGIIDEYIETARPVSSISLVDKLSLTVSSATIRNEMHELEAQGYITHPHTSAGRVPTEAGYIYYTEHFLDAEEQLTVSEQARLREANRQQTAETSEMPLKRIAKQVAALAQDAVLLTLADQSFYYTGITNLFRKPEFQASAEVIVLSELIDHLDEVMTQLHKREIDDIALFLGADNPVSSACATMVIHYDYLAPVTGVMAILGPLRMNYQHNYQLLRQVRQLLQTTNI